MRLRSEAAYPRAAKICACALIASSVPPNVSLLGPHVLRESTGGQHGIGIERAYRVRGGGAGSTGGV